MAFRALTLGMLGLRSYCLACSYLPWQIRKSLSPGPISTARVNGESVPMWTTLDIRKGEEVSLKGLKSGLRAYMAIAGGLAVEPVLGSRATYVKGAIGGIEGRELRPGDILHVYDKPIMKELYRVPEDSRDAYQMGYCPRRYSARRIDLYTEEARGKFLAEPWRLLPEADRMGFRMEGRTLGFETATWPRRSIPHRTSWMTSSAGWDPNAKRRPHHRDGR